MRVVFFIGTMTTSGCSGVLMMAFNGQEDHDDGHKKDSGTQSNVLQYLWITTGYGDDDRGDEPAKSKAAREDEKPFRDGSENGNRAWDTDLSDEEDRVGYDKE